jgi:transposase, IS5 family
MRLDGGHTGCKGRSATSSTASGWDRTMMDGIDGARIWCGRWVLAHNLVKISGLIEAMQGG